MAHEIDHSTGRPAIAYVGEAPWHELGEKLPERQSIETCTSSTEGFEQWTTALSL